MARTNNPSVSVTNYAITSFTNSGGGNTLAFNIALSAETSSNLIGYLSGNATVATPFLSATVGTTALSTLSVTAGSLTWPSIAGNNDFYVNVTGTVVPLTSAYSLTVRSNSPDFILNTVIYLSATATTIGLSSGNVTTLDNPFVAKGAIVNSANENNNTIRTMGDHLRRWSLMG